MPMGRRRSHDKHLPQGVTLEWGTYYFRGPDRKRLSLGRDFAEAMRTEYRIVSRIARGHDFYEGVRAVVIDKDQAPRWQPATLDDVEQVHIDAYFAPLGADELKLEG